MVRTKALLLFLGTLVGVAGGLWAVLELLGYLGFSLLQNKGLGGLAIVAFIALTAALLVLFLRGEITIRDNEFEPGSEHDYDGRKLSKVIISELHRLAACQDHQTILRIGLSLSSGARNSRFLV